MQIANPLLLEGTALTKKRIAAAVAILGLVIGAIALLSTTGARFTDQKTGTITGHSGKVKITTTGCDVVAGPDSLNPGTTLTSNCVVTNESTMPATLKATSVVTVDGEAMTPADMTYLTVTVNGLPADGSTLDLGTMTPGVNPAPVVVNVQLSVDAGNVWQNRTVTVTTTLVAEQVL